MAQALIESMIIVLRRAGRSTIIASINKKVLMVALVQRPAVKANMVVNVAVLRRHRDSDTVISWGI